MRACFKNVFMCMSVHVWFMQVCVQVYTPICLNKEARGRYWVSLLLTALILLDSLST